MSVDDDEGRRLMLYGPCWTCGGVLDVLTLRTPDGGLWMGVRCATCAPDGFEPPDDALLTEPTPEKP